MLHQSIISHSFVWTLLAKKKRGHMNYDTINSLVFHIYKALNQKFLSVHHGCHPSDNKECNGSLSCGNQMDERIFGRMGWENLQMDGWEHVWMDAMKESLNGWMRKYSDDWEKCSSTRGKGCANRWTGPGPARPGIRRDGERVRLAVIQPARRGERESDGAVVMIRPNRASVATMRCPLSKTMLRLETPIWFGSSCTPRELLCMNSEIRCPGFSSPSYWGGTWVPELLGFCVLVAVVLVVVWSSWWRRRNPSNALFFCGREAMVFFIFWPCMHFTTEGFVFMMTLASLLSWQRRSELTWIFFSSSSSCWASSSDWEKPSFGGVRSNRLTLWNETCEEQVGVFLYVRWNPTCGGVNPFPLFSLWWVEEALRATTREELLLFSFSARIKGEQHKHTPIILLPTGFLFASHY